MRDYRLCKDKTDKQLLLLIVFFLQGYTATTCASYALVATFILYLAVEPKAFVSRIKNLIKGLIDSAKSMLKETDGKIRYSGGKP